MELKAEGAVLGQFPQWIYKQSEIRVGAGDEILLFTDGLVEACDMNQELFGELRMVKVAQEQLEATASESMNSLLAAASRHCSGNFHDDASLIVVKQAKA